MRKIFSVSAILALAFAGPAFAQGASQTPPAPNSSSGMPQPANSLPAGAQTGTASPATTGNVGTTSTVTGAPVPGSAGAAAPAFPSGSTTANPSGAFQQTVPQPATR